MVRVGIPPVLRRYAGDHASVRVTGATVRAALADLFAQWPDLRPRVLDTEGRLHPYLQLFADGAQATDLEVPVTRELDILTAAEGG